MSARLRFWWSLRSVREQRMLLVMAALAFIVLAWLLIVRPVTDRLEEARGRVQRATIALGEARSEAATITRLEQGATPGSDLPVNVIVGQKAGEAGFALERIEPQSSGAVSIAIAAVRPQAFFAWAAALERDQGLVVDRLSARTNSDRTLAVEAVIRARIR